MTPKEKLMEFLEENNFQIQANYTDEPCLEYPSIADEINENMFFKLFILSLDNSVI